MAAPSVFRRWSRFFSAFEAIDAAVVASDDPGGELALTAGDLRRFKAEFVELLCDAADEERAEAFCKNLDELMVECLISLKLVPVKPAALKATGVARAVAALQEHECEKIRGLARDMLARWRAAAESGIPEAGALREELGKLSGLVPVSRAPVVGEVRSTCHLAAAAESAKKKQETDAPPCSRANPLRAHTAATAKTNEPAVLGDDHLAETEKMKVTKRKLFEGYKEHEDAKRQRRIQIIVAPNVVPEQKQLRKVRPIPLIAGRKCQGTDAPPCRTRTARPDMADIRKTKTPPSHAAAGADSAKNMPVIHAPPCRARIIRADSAAVAKTKTPSLSAHAAAESAKKTPVSDAPPCRERAIGADSAAVAKTNTKTPAFLGNGQVDEIEKMKATKRKLFEGYKEHEDAKRQRRIQVIEAPKTMPEQRPRKAHPILRARSLARCGAPSAAARRSLMPALQQI